MARSKPFAETVLLMPHPQGKTVRRGLYLDQWVMDDAGAAEVGVRLLALAHMQGEADLAAAVPSTGRDVITFDPAVEDELTLWRALGHFADLAGLGHHAECVSIRRGLGSMNFGSAVTVSESKAIPA